MKNVAFIIVMVLASIRFIVPLSAVEDEIPRPIFGIVVGSDGKPVVGATVYLTPWFTDDRKTTTNAEGRFQFDGKYGGNFIAFYAFNTDKSQQCYFFRHFPQDSDTEIIVQRYTND